MRITLLFLVSLAAACGRGLDVPVDGGQQCPPGSSPIGCPGGVTLYCCPASADCAPPSCHAAPDAATSDDASTCPAGQYLLIPCCGGDDDSACSNGSPPPQPFCTTLPSPCDGQASCAVGDCDGPLDETKRTLQCFCL